MRSLLDVVFAPTLSPNQQEAVAMQVAEPSTVDAVAPLLPLANLLRGADLPPPEVHIMMVEDYAMSRKMMSIYLRRKGYHVHAFGTATEALAWAALAAPSAILLDVLLPDISGLDLFDRLRAMPHLYKIPVMFVTSFSGQRYEQQCLERGAAAFFQKPAYLPAIAASISQMLRL
ncbi:MAG: response regulator [Ktedonobacterales bacterium]|nr:response regulator [Ktedonobacterales bacterium]